jgi:hypothetical protein
VFAEYVYHNDKVKTHYIRIRFRPEDTASIGELKCKIFLVFPLISRVADYFLPAELERFGLFLRGMQVE